MPSNASLLPQSSDKHVACGLNADVFVANAKYPTGTVAIRSINASSF
jgi:hypothetical protein